MSGSTSDIKVQQIGSLSVGAPQGAQRSTRNNRLPVHLEIQAREDSDRQFAAKMIQARRELASDVNPMLPESLSALRMSRGLSQSALAKMIGTSQSHIAKIEARKISIYLETAQKLANALGISIGDLCKFLLVADTNVLKPMIEAI